VKVQQASRCELQSPERAAAAPTRSGEGATLNHGYGGTRGGSVGQPPPVRYLNEKATGCLTFASTRRPSRGLGGGGAEGDVGAQE
jgi:hypothetical protein